MLPTLHLFKCGYGMYIYIYKYIYIEKKKQLCHHKRLLLSTIIRNLQYSCFYCNAMLQCRTSDLRTFQRFNLHCANTRIKTWRLEKSCAGTYFRTLSKAWEQPESDDASGESCDFLN